jgi:heparosan-N-sulfate-glucuronate 5-epimerase
MSIAARVQYYRRIGGAYLRPAKSQLNFWHDTPQVNPHAPLAALGEYYMPFFEKANYSDHYDSAGIPMLDYRGRIGLQYNPIAIAQWGLGNCNLYLRTQADANRRAFLAASTWLCDHLESNSFGLSVWNHHFDWDYRSRLRSPWYSGLAQGQGISLLVRAYRATREAAFLNAAERSFQSFLKPLAEGGVSYTDDSGDLWFEEYIVSPPTHILNGFIWAAWGVYDYFLATGDATAKTLFDRSIRTLCNNLEHYDLGFWSLYEQSGTRLPMVASPFYHRLHIVQLRVLYRISGEHLFREFADRWEAYCSSRSKRTRALCYKSAFKLCYY